MEKKITILIIILVAVIAAASFGAAYEMKIGPFEEDDDDDDKTNNNNEKPEDNQPVAVAEVDKIHADVNENITFNASASYDEEENITGYLWNFDDGTTSDNITYVHQFASHGAYNVSLTVEGVSGNTNTTNLFIGIIQRGNTSGTTSDSDSYDLQIDEMASAVYINSTIENDITDPDSTEFTLSLIVNGTTVWEESHESNWGDSVDVPYSKTENITAEIWTWNLEITTSGISGTLNWDSEYVVIYV